MLGRCREGTPCSPSAVTVAAERLRAEIVQSFSRTMVEAHDGNSDSRVPLWARGCAVL